MTLPSVIHATLEEVVAERHPDADEDVHFTRALARTVIEALTDPGEIVLDPFAGFGTTLEVAAELGRVAVGVELLPERVASIRTRVPGAVVVEGDTRGLHALVATGELPVRPGTVALALSSPPYMTAIDHPENPLTAYETSDGDYRRYVRELGDIAGQVRTLLRAGGHLALNVADIDHAGHLTPLVADTTETVGAVLPHVATIAVEWDELPHDLVADKVVVFRRPR